MMTCVFIVSVTGGCASPACDAARLLRDMHARYVEHMRSLGRDPVDIETFAFSTGCTKYFFKVGDLVRRKDDGSGTIRIVRRYRYDGDALDLSGDATACATDLVIANVPPEILEIARERLAAECPLLRKEAK